MKLYSLVVWIACSLARASAFRAALVISANNDRWANAARVLRGAGAFDDVRRVEPVSPDADEVTAHIAAKNIHVTPWGTAAEETYMRKACSNHLTHVSALLRNDTGRWVHVFENDVALDDRYAGDPARLKREIDEAERVSELLGLPFLYTGFCPGGGDAAAACRQGAAGGPARCFGSCSHAYAVDNRASETFVKEARALLVCATGVECTTKHLFWDVALYAAGERAGGFVTVGADRCRNGFCGAFYQDRDTFATTI